ncbi:MAG: PQQ-binding-like beta-propeller repeat protein [Campylobacterales bacterium]|nr:PQQ-binding-like beta-propeller repeat protein [Campylobacterales bacterium]MBN2831781.1 PQQ-binding-like beta-propeller repeat protein [Campylobacterales bacterium]
MRYAKILFSLFTLLLVVSGCGTKRQYFEPESLSGKLSYDGSLPASIVDANRDGATLENGQVVTKQGLSSVVLPKSYVYLGENNGRYVASSQCGALVVLDANQKTLFKKECDVSVASAALNGNLLALVLGSNELVLIDINDGRELMHLSQDNVYALDSRIAAPYFLGDLIIFPTLDGKLIIVDAQTKKPIRDVVVSNEKFFGNIIYLQVLGDRLVAATKSKVVSISPKSIHFLETDVRDVIVLKNRIFVFTKDGKVILTDADLNVLKDRKFTFATFAGTIYGNFIYMIEKGGYVIATDIDLISTNVYKLPDEIESNVFTTEDTLYYKNHFFKLNRK